MAEDFGTDLSCLSDLNPRCGVVSGRRLLAEAIVRRITTPRGRLINDPNYGFDVTGYINDDIRPSDIAALQSGVSAECLKDERVNAATVSASLSAQGTLTMTISLDDGDGPFSLTVAVSAITVDILRLDQ